MINRRIIKIDAADIRVGKVCPWKDGLLAFDETGGQMLQLSGSGEIIQRLSLKEIVGIKRIDTVFIYEENMLIADSLGNKLFRLTIAAGKDGKLTFSAVNEFPQAAGTIIVAVAKVGEYYWLLDKGKCQIHVCDKDFNEIKTIGSRMGYIYEYDEDTMPRLGFEFPEDMAQDGERIVVSDSGNKRLVVLNSEGKQLDVIKLPEFPYKIIAMEGDKVMVSDFDRTVMVVSLKYGFIYKEEIETPVDFFPSVYHRQRHIVGSESKELVELNIDDTSLEELAEKAANHLVMMKIKVDKNEITEARNMVYQYPELLPEYAAYYYDDTESVSARLTDYINQTVATAFKENENLKTEIAARSLEFVKKYKAIPDSEDQEAAHIEKEHVRHQLFLIIKKYRRNLYLVKSLKQKMSKYSTILEILDGLLDKRFEIVRHRLSEAVQSVEENLEPLNDLELLGAIVDYWLWEEEERVIFTFGGFCYRKLFNGQFLLGILNDFNFSIASLFLQRHKIEEYISFCDMEISMFPDKMGIFTAFLNQLLLLGKYEDILRMLGKFPDQNKENVNYFYYRVYQAKSDLDAAFKYLKKEIELYSHRVQLIPELIRLRKLNPEEITHYIEKIMDTPGQSIDTYLNVAQAFFYIRERKKSEKYVDKELKLFPENKRAMILKTALFNLRPENSLSVEYCQRVWNQFRKNLLFKRDEYLIEKTISLFSVLDNLPVDGKLITTLITLKVQVELPAFRKEIIVFLSLMKHFLGEKVDANLELLEHESYLSSHSTSKRACNYFCGEVERLKTAGEWEKMIDLAEKILKFNPGNERIFRLLDELSEGEELP